MNFGSKELAFSAALLAGCGGAVNQSSPEVAGPDIQMPALGSEIPTSAVSTYPQSAFYNVKFDCTVGYHLEQGDKRDLNPALHRVFSPEACIEKSIQALKEACHSRFLDIEVQIKKPSQENAPRFWVCPPPVDPVCGAGSHLETQLDPNGSGKAVSACLNHQAWDDFTFFCDEVNGKIKIQKCPGGDYWRCKSDKLPGAECFE